MVRGPRRALIIVLAVASLAGSLVRIGPAGADPTLVDNGNGTSDAVWNFGTPGDYALANAAISGGVASLASQTSWWNSTTAADFAGPDSESNVDRTTWPGEVALASSSGPPALVTLQPGAPGEDTYLDRNNPNTNHGGDTTVLLDGRNPIQYWPLLRFDLSPIPANVVIDDATVSLYESTGVGNSVVASAFQVTSQWNELQATWNDRLTGTPWTTPGGDYGTHVLDVKTLDNIAGWRSWNITNLVDLWYRGRLPNYGFVLTAPNPGATSVKTFYSSDYNVDPTRRPKLDIKYRTLGSVGTYVSRVGGPGTMALWQTIAWNATERSLASDEFAGPGLDPKWVWTNVPGSFDVSVTSPGSLHVVSSTGVDFAGGTFTGNVLANNLVGDFTATMKFSTAAGVNGQKAGLMVLVGPRDWYALWKMNVAGVRNWRVAATADALTTTRVDVNSGNPTPAWVRIQRVGNAFTSSTSPDGATWTVRDTYTPTFEYPLSVRLATTFADGGSGTAITTDVDYVRIAFGNDAAVSVSTRTGNVTPVDGTWSAFTPPYPTSAGSAMAGSAKFLEYRLSFAVTYPDHIPVAGDANLSWFRYLPSGTVETNDLTPAALAAWGTLSTVQILNGQSISYEYSLNSGGSWAPVVPPADLSAVSTATGKVRFLATMSTADTLVTPTLSEIRLSYTHVLDQFYVTASPTATAGAPFSITITAKDAGNATIVGWTGTVALAAFLSDGVTPAGGSLGTTSLAITTGGTATLATETYTKAETIKVRATYAAAIGLSGPIAISPGPVFRVVIAPNNVTLLPFDTADFVGQAFDVFNNVVPSISFNWTVGGGVGSVNVSTGPAVRFTASPPPANGTLQMAFGPITDTAQIHVVSGVKPWITIVAPAAGAHVTGIVPIGYANSSDAVTVRFEYDGGAGWTLIGTTAVLNGTYDWDTSPLNFVGGSVRAIVTNNRTITNTTVVTPIEVDNTPPTIALGAIIDNQAGSGTLTILYATDPDVVRVDLTYFDGAWNPIGTDVTIDGTYLWTPGVPINGVTVRAVAVDEVALKGADQKQGVGNFPPGPNPPAIAALPDVHVQVGVAYALNLTFYVTDPDTPRSALVISDSDAANVTAVSGTYPALNITYGSIGTFLVTVWVSDGTDTAWTIVRVIVSAAQSPPSLVAALPTVTFDEDTTAWNGLGSPATTFFLDPDGDPLTFAVLDGIRVLALVNANGTIDFSAAANWSGSELLRLRATDPSGGFAEAAFPVIVRPVNDPPILVTAFAAIAFNEDTLASDVFGGNVTGHFFDVDGDPLTITVLGTGNVSARVNLGDTIDLWAAANWSGTQTLRVRATDPNGTFVEGSFLVTVRPINDSPIVAAALPTVTFNEDTVAVNAFGGAVTPHFFDVDGDVLTFTVLGATQVTARVNADRTVDLWATINWSGSEALRVRATDPSGDFVEAPFQVIVRPVDDAPMLAPIAALTINEGETRTLDLSSYVSDIDTNRSLLAVTTDSPYVTANGFVLTMAFPSNWTDSRFTVIVSDGTLAASQVVSVTIVPPFWKSVYFLPVPPMFLAVVIGVFAQRARWRPTKAFLVDERGEMIREFTLDRSCDVTFDQVRQAGALDAVEKSVKVSKYHARTVRGDALGLVLLAYGPVTADQVEFAREMLVNVQDKFDDRVKQRLDDLRSTEASLASAKASLESQEEMLAQRAAAVAGVYDAITVGEARAAEHSRTIQALTADLETREAQVHETQRSQESRGEALEELGRSVDARTKEVQAQEARIAELAAGLDARQEQVERLRENLPEREKAVMEREARAEALEGDVRSRVVEIAEAKKAADATLAAVTADREGLGRDRAAFESEKKEFESRTAHFTEDIRRRSQELGAQTKSLQEMHVTLTQAREAFEAMRQEKTAWIASKDIELEARQHTLNDKEAAVRGQAEANAEQLADLASREEAYEVAGDRLQRERGELDARKADLAATAKTLEAKAADLRDHEAKKAEEYRAWESAQASQQALLKEQRETFDRESSALRESLNAKRSELEAQTTALAEREAKARSSVEWVLRTEDELKVREERAKDASEAAGAIKAEVDAARAELASRTADLETREHALEEQAARHAGEFARRADVAQTEDAAIANRRAAFETEMSEREVRMRTAETEFAKREDQFAEKTVVLFSRESQLDGLKESLDRERADQESLSRQLAAKQVELSQAVQRTEEEGARLRSEVDTTRQALAAREAELRSEQERLARESQSLQDTLGAKAVDLAARESGIAGREATASALAQETDARVREVEFREHQASERDRELGKREGSLEKEVRDFQARATQLDRAQRAFAEDQEQRRAEWASRTEAFTSESSRTKSEAESRAAELEARTAEVERREREASTAQAKGEEERTRLAGQAKASATKAAEAADAWAAAERRIAEVRVMEAELQQSRQEFEAERAAWGPRRDQELKQLEATRDAVTEQSQKAENMLEEAERRASVATEAERAAAHRVEEQSTQQQALDARRTEFERAERAMEAQSAQIQDATRKLASRDMELSALAKELDARAAKVELGAKAAAGTAKDLESRQVAIKQDEARLAKLSKETAAARDEAESQKVEAEARLVDVVEREKTLKAREADVRTRGSALPKLEAVLSGRESAVAEKEASVKAQAQEFDRRRLEIESAVAKMDADRRAATAARAEADEARANAEKTRAQAEAQQAEVAKSMKFLQKKAVDVLDREEKMRKKEAEVDEKERLLEGKFEIVETKERSLEAEGEEQAQKLARMEAELEKMRTRLAEAEKGGKVAADVEERNKDLESRLKIIQRKAMELLDREEKVRVREEALKDGPEKRGVTP